MAFYGCFSTSFFNTIFAFIITTVKELLESKKGFIEFNIFYFSQTYDRLVVYILFYGIFHCICLIFLFCYFKFELTKDCIKYFVCLYVIFLAGLFYANYQIEKSILL